MKPTRIVLGVLLVLGMLWPALAADIASGPDVGAHLQPFNPYHVAGQDKGTDTCPV